MERTVFALRSELLQHLEEHISRGDRNYQCSACKKRFCLARQLREHKRHHLAKSVMCPHCPRRFRSETALQEHMYTHTGCRPFRCSHCKKIFASRYTLKVHCKTHSVRERNHKCMTCHKEFLSYHHLSEHMHIHEGSRQHTCNVCGKAFATLRSLDLHMVIHSGVKNYSCKLCNKQFARKGEVEDHERTHTGEKPFQCEICGATFSQRSNLQSHKRATHLKEKRHKCTQCHKAFKRRRLLVYHMMSVHTGERPYKCEKCNAAFVYPEHYKKHLRIHTGEKPFKCEICGKAFNSRDNRNAHKFIHSERKPYECTICNMGFMRKPMLLTHLVQHGPLSAQPEACVRVNPPSVADEPWPQAQAIAADDGDLYATADSLKIVPEELEESVELVGPDGVEVVSRPVHIFQTDNGGRYIIQSGDRASILASLHGQVLEAFQVKSDSVHYELSADDSNNAGGTSVAASSSNVDQLTVGGRSFEIQLSGRDDEEDELELQTVSATEAVELTGMSCVDVAGSSSASQEDNNSLLSRSFQFDGPSSDSGTLNQLRTIKVLPPDCVVGAPSNKESRVATNRTMWNDAGSFIGPD